MAREKILKGKPTRLYHTKESRKAFEGLKRKWDAERGEALSDTEVCRIALELQWYREKP
jgi:hypothetical protein